MIEPELTKGLANVILLPLLTIHEDGYGAVVHKVYFHIGAEATRFNGFFQQGAELCNAGFV